MHLLWLELALVRVQSPLVLNEPPAPPSLQVTPPEGEVVDALVSDTVAVKVN